MAAVGILLLLVSLVIAVVALPTLWLHKRYDAYLEDYSDRLQRYRRVAASRPVIETAILEIDKRDGRKYYLKGASPTLVVAELQGLVTRTIEAHMGKIASSQGQPVKDEAKATEPAKSAISVQFTASVPSLQLILHAIEIHEPYLFIDQLAIRAHQSRMYKPVPGVQPEFIIQMTVSAYALGGGAKP
jgi:general secretion pathway protein M